MWVIKRNTLSIEATVSVLFRPRIAIDLIRSKEIEGSVVVVV